MIIVALDTSDRRGSVAVAKDRIVLGHSRGDPAITHGERLPGDILSLLDSLGLPLRAVDLFAVIIGPGSFTGLRVGIATIQGLAMAIERPVIGISALEAMARAAAAGPASAAAAGDLVGVWMDAQRGEIFSELWRCERDRVGPVALTPVEPAAVGPPGETIDRWTDVRGDRPLWLVSDEAIRHRAGADASFGAGTTVIDPLPLAPTVAVMAAERAEAGESAPPHALRPLYVRRPDAELARASRSRGRK